MWKCVDLELERQIRCFPYGERSDVPRPQQVEQKAVGRQRNLGLVRFQMLLKIYMNLYIILHMYLGLSAK